MGINKVNYGNTTLIDISNDTVTADKLAQGYTAHDNTGAAITGTAEMGGLHVETIIYNATSASRGSFTIPGVTHEPKAFIYNCSVWLTRYSSGGSTTYPMNIRFDGTNVYGSYWMYSSGTFVDNQIKDSSHSSYAEFSFSYDAANSTLTFTVSAVANPNNYIFQIGRVHVLTYFY